MPTLLLTGGRLIDPSRGLDQTGDLFVKDGRIAELPRPEERGAIDRTIDVSGCIVSPGFIDCCVKLGEPGAEEDETIATGTAAAIAGGFTTVAARPDTQPVVDTRAAAEFVTLQAERARHCRVVPLGAVTKQTAGEELAEIGQLVDGKAAAFTDGARAIANSEIMRRALQYTGMFGRPLLHLPQVPELVAHGVMHDGFYSTVLGLRGIPAAAEEIMVRRDIALAEQTGGHVHLMAISTRRSVREIRFAQSRGVPVSAHATPHHLALTDEALQEYEPRFKFMPPLRSRDHLEALIEGLQDGTISVISSGHEPYAAEKKDRELDQAPFGAAGLETALAVCIRALIEPGHLDWPALLGKLTSGPAALLNLTDRGSLEVGTLADITVIDPAAQWTVDPFRFATQSRTSPFAGWTLRGRVRLTIVDGDVRMT